MAIIDLGKHRSEGTYVFSGRKRGEAVRRSTDLDKLDETENQVTVRIPQDTISFNSSFFLGMFGKSVRKLGLSEFEKKFIFDCDEGHLEDIEDGKERALLESDVLGSDP